jgi:hypothetical protein
MPWIARGSYEQASFLLRIEAMAPEYCGNKPTLPLFVMKIPGIASSHVVWIARPRNYSFAFQKYPQTKSDRRTGDRIKVNWTLNLEPLRSEIGAVNQVFSDFPVGD